MLREFPRVRKAALAAELELPFSSSFEGRADSREQLESQLGCRVVIDNCTRAMAAKLYSPERITFGGGLTGIGDRLFDPLEREFTKRVMPTIGSRATFGVAHLGDRAGIMGAVAVGLDSFVFSIQE